MNASDASKASVVPRLASDLRGMSRLGVDATLGITNLVESMHHVIASRSGIVGKMPHGRTTGITGLVYGAVRGTTRAVGHGLDAILSAFAGPADAGITHPGREAMLAVLNGLWGDHLADTANPLAVPMNLRIDGQVLDLADSVSVGRLREPRPRIVVLVHGLCMNDLQWRHHGHDHGQLLARGLDATALYLHYNSGRHISQNGRAFAALLEQLVTRWPVPVESLTLIGHSMGGLVMRSACHYGQQGPNAWPGLLRDLVFLGTPHQGAPLERGGRLIDALLEVSPYAAPFGRLGRARSAGITDLRYGNLQDADWQGRDQAAQRRDDRVPTPLPTGVACYAVAARRSTSGDKPGAAAIGDGLVPVESALGEHRDPALSLNLPEAHRMVINGANHWDLLSRDEVYVQLRDWLHTGTPTRTSAGDVKPR